MKSELEAIRLKMKSLIDSNPNDVYLNSEIDSSIEWIESALIRLEAREEVTPDWFEGAL